MGNCIGLKKKKKNDIAGLAIEHPLVSKWLASSDFSTIPPSLEGSPTLSVKAAEQHRQHKMDQEIIDSVIKVNYPIEDGYLTAAENLSEDEEIGPLTMHSTVAQSVGQLEGDSIYETSDEAEGDGIVEWTKANINESTYADASAELPRMDESMFTMPMMSTPPPFHRLSLSQEEIDEADDQVGEEVLRYRNDYDARPIRPLPTPIRKNLVSPRVHLEDLVDKSGRVRRDRRVTSYLDEKRRSLQTAV